MIEPSLMRMLIAVREAGGLGRAGEKLGLTQQAISAQLKRLETMAGRPLVSRAATGATLTPAGEDMVGFARRAVALEDEVRRHFAAVTITGSLRIGVSEAFAAAGLPILLRALNVVTPDLEISVLNGRAPTLEAAIENGAIDIAIGLQRMGEGRGETILSDRAHWMGDPDMASDDAAAIRLAVHPAPSVLRDLMIDAVSTAGRVHAVTFESESQTSLRAATLAGIAIGCVAFEDRESEDAAFAAALPPLGAVEIFLRPRSGAPDAAHALAHVFREQAGLLFKVDRR